MRDTYERACALDEGGGLEGVQGFGDEDWAADLVNQLPDSP
ncbi:MAG: hypothetical protein ABSG93_20685 [Solirubrobacteraceae bacterium]